jgi:hypothetical protein
MPGTPSLGELICSAIDEIASMVIPTKRYYVDAKTRADRAESSPSSPAGRSFIRKDLSKKVTPKKPVANVPKKEEFLKMADMDAFIRYLHNFKIPDFDDLWSRGKDFRSSSQAKLMHPQYKSNCFMFMISEMEAVEEMANTLMNERIRMSMATRRQGFDAKDMVSDKEMSTEGMFFIVKFPVPTISLEQPVLPSHTNGIQLDTELPARDEEEIQLDTELPARDEEEIQLDTGLPVRDEDDTLMLPPSHTTTTEVTLKDMRVDEIAADLACSVVNNDTTENESEATGVESKDILFLIMVVPKRICSKTIFKDMKKITQLGCVVPPKFKYVLNNSTLSCMDTYKYAQWLPIGALGDNTRLHPSIMRMKVGYASTAGAWPGDPENEES